ncbi:MAG: hypothetical protein ACTHMS_10580, partial [Jatrophihabitans sp.]
MRSGSAPTTARFAAHHAGHAAAMRASVARPSSRPAAIDQSESPARTTTGSWSARAGDGRAGADGLGAVGQPGAAGGAGVAGEVRRAGVEGRGAGAAALVATGHA